MIAKATATTVDIGNTMIDRHDTVECHAGVAGAAAGGVVVVVVLVMLITRRGKVCGRTGEKVKEITDSSSL